MSVCDHIVILELDDDIFKHFESDCEYSEADESEHIDIEKFEWEEGCFLEDSEEEGGTSQTSQEAGIEETKEEKEEEEEEEEEDNVETEDGGDGKENEDDAKKLAGGKKKKVPFHLKFKEIRASFREVYEEAIQFPVECDDYDSCEAGQQLCHILADEEGENFIVVNNVEPGSEEEMSLSYYYIDESYQGSSVEEMNFHLEVLENEARELGIHNDSLDDSTFTDTFVESGYIRHADGS